MSKEKKFYRISYSLSKKNISIKFDTWPNVTNESKMAASPWAKIEKKIIFTLLTLMAEISNLRRLVNLYKQKLYYLTLYFFPI